MHNEISKGSVVKTEFDHQLHMPVVDRVLHGSHYYFFNYGFVPETISGDKDPLDVVILCDTPLPVNHLVPCKLLGYLNTSDDKGIDEKLIVVPADRVDPASRGIDDIENVHDWQITRLKDFFQHYKALEKKTCVVKDLHGRAEATELVKKARHRYQVMNRFLNRWRGC